jgi:hypothetical protein
MKTPLLLLRIFDFVAKFALLINNILDYEKHHFVSICIYTYLLR